ncbi:hypothetical protein SBA2_120014 [Acidobacteriia bacterium SbA2]|nr:hypothetical protein SBA2_120014 [Acidobacteriia bacterium SbA2]
MRPASPVRVGVLNVCWPGVSSSQLVSRATHSPEGAAYGIRCYHAPSRLEPEMKYPRATSTRVAGLQALT